MKRYERIAGFNNFYYTREIRAGGRFGKVDIILPSLQYSTSE